MYNLTLSEEAILDIVDVTNWYENQKIGLGFDFSVQLTEIFQKIIDSPESFRFLFDTKRYAKLKQFPYNVYYNIDELNSEIYIFAILHEKRNPSIWKKRLT
jgi:toxin ParE1/3/4